MERENARRKRETDRAAPKVVGWLRSTVDAPSEWPQGVREHQIEGRKKNSEREREAKLMQLLSRTKCI